MLSERENYFNVSKLPSIGILDKRKTETFTIKDDLWQTPSTYISTPRDTHVQEVHRIAVRRVIGEPVDN